MSGNDNDRRDDAWLRERLEAVRATFFRDLPPGKPIVAGFGRAARTRFGSIAARPACSRITINGLFRSTELPAFVVDATIAHELAHYAHGWGSGLRKQHAHPHRGGVVSRELADRGLADLEARADAWRKANWQRFYETHAQATVARAAARKDRDAKIWAAYLATPGFRTEEDLQALADEVARRFGLPRAPFEVRWLRASLRERAESYCRRDRRCVLVHGLLADPKAPRCVVVTQLAYWIARLIAGPSGDAPGLTRRAGLAADATKAASWSAHAWSRRLRAHHPLRAAR